MQDTRTADVVQSMWEFIPSVLGYGSWVIKMLQIKTAWNPTYQKFTDQQLRQADEKELSLAQSFLESTNEPLVHCKCDVIPGQRLP